MSYNSVSEIFNEIDGTRARLLQSVEGLSDEQHGFRPTPDKWSVAQLCDHLSIVEGNVLKVLNKMLGKAEETPGAQRANGAAFEPVSIEEHAERARGVKLEAPEAVRPSDSRPLAESLAALGDSRTALHALRPQLERFDGHALRFPHPAWGPLNLYQWLLFIGAHEARHIAQIEALKEDMNAHQ
ncbi:MAG: hypothetical protein QOJ70_1726 [Acidobacteriota bacterium]|jgi:uncharacterized damage-inducible protein DinB|nr:hypothetical protein [Acidobacteriota bacterium]MDT7807913.1 hypothetical protein [Acidobacteriota bacterium]